MFLNHLYNVFSLNEEEIKRLNNPASIPTAYKRLSDLQRPSRPQSNLLARLTSYVSHSTSASAKAIELLSNRLPYFLYFNVHDPMSGKVSINKLVADQENNSLSAGDRVFLDLLSLASLNLDDLEKCSEEELNSLCENASNIITKKIFKFWSQNKHLQFQLKIAYGLPTEPEPFSAGLVASARIVDKDTLCSLPFSEQSAGFIWFFSFLVKFFELSEQESNFIILLDEPGLTVHGTAQGDLLQYFSEVIEPKHQLIYSTHSPFMVPAKDLSVVRVVENIASSDLVGKERRTGTIVKSSFPSIDKSSNLPVLNAMGYTLTQGLLIKPNMLLVEGPSDSLYLEVFSRELALLGRANLDSSWAICPTGGVDKIQLFITLFCKSDLNIFVLCDHDELHSGKVDKLRRTIRENNLIDSDRILCVTEFVEQRAADVEDLLAPELYIKLVNEACGLKGSRALKIEKFFDQRKENIRIVKEVERYFLKKSFEHARPARYLLSNPGFLSSCDENLIEITLKRFEQIFRKIGHLNR